MQQREDTVVRREDDAVVVAPGEDLPAAPDVGSTTTTKIVFGGKKGTVCRKTNAPWNRSCDAISCVMSTIVAFGSI
jgi:hypothetical protein